MMTEYPVRTRAWTRREYDRLVSLGILHEDEPVELLDGQLIVAEPKGTPLARPGFAAAVVDLLP